MSSPEIYIGCVANLWARQMIFAKAGDAEDGHTHQFDHLTLLAKGRLSVLVDGAETEFIAPHMIYIHKDKYHKLVALEDGTVAYCIHALRTKDQTEILDPSMIPRGENMFEALVGDICKDMKNPVSYDGALIPVYKI